MWWIEQLETANWHQTLAVSLSAYLLGCFATGYYLVRFRLGEDIRMLGSCNIGAKNVGRVLGKSGFLLTAFGDGLKGLLAVWIAKSCVMPPAGHMMALALLAAIAGHLWPFQLRFHGGKGMATLVGALVIYDYRSVLIFALFFVFGLAVFRKSVLPGLFAILSLPFADYYFLRDPVTATFMSVAVGLVLLAHRRNIIEECAHLISHHDPEPQIDHPDL